MMTGEAKTLETQETIVQLDNKSPQQAEFMTGAAKNEVSNGEKIIANLKVSERFSRLKKSLRKKSVSIL